MLLTYWTFSIPPIETSHYFFTSSRNNAALEEGFNEQTVMELVICGHLYVMDFEEMIQYRKDRGPLHNRKLKRDSIDAACKGVAGLVPKK